VGSVVSREIPIEAIGRRGIVDRRVSDVSEAGAVGERALDRNRGLES